MKKALILALLLSASCGGSVETSVGSIRVNIPSGWIEGIGPNPSQAVSIILYPKLQGDTLSTIMPDVERMIGNPARYSNSDGSVGFKGTFQIPYNSVYAKTESFSMTGRDLAIEAARLEKTDGSNAMPIDTAKINIREMALMLEYAKKNSLMPTSEEIDAEIKLSYEQAAKTKMTKDMFLANWGITEDEFRFIATQKLAYEKVIVSVTKNAKSNQEFVSMAGKFKNDLFQTMDHQVLEIEPAEVVATVLDVKDAFAVVIAFDSEEIAKGMAETLKVTGAVFPGQVYNFSRSR